MLSFFSSKTEKPHTAEAVWGLNLRKRRGAYAAFFSSSSSFSLASNPFFLRALMRALTLTDEAAVTVASALSPVLGPTSTSVTPLTLSSADRTFFGHPPAHLRPDTARVMVCSSAATISAVCAIPAATGAAMAPAERTAKAAIMVILVFIVSR